MRVLSVSPYISSYTSVGKVLFSYSVAFFSLRHSKCNIRYSRLFHNLPLHRFLRFPTLSQIQQLHAYLLVLGLATNVSAAGQLLAFCALSQGAPPQYAWKIFCQINCPNVFSWNNLIRNFAKSEEPGVSLCIYLDMLRQEMRPNNYTYPFVLQGCSKLGYTVCGLQVHAHVIKFGLTEDLYIRNALINFYGEVREMKSSRMVFDESPVRDIVSWNAILAGYFKDKMITVAEQLFDEMPHRDVITWSTMIMGYVQFGDLEKGLELFRVMLKKGLIPNEAIMVTTVSACAQMGLLDQGQFIHSIIQDHQFPISVQLGTALIDMYAKCGCINKSKKVFDQMHHRDISTWNSMICGFAMHGLGREAVELFQNLIDKGLRPVNVTFVGILNACSRCGFVNEGRHYFKSMIEDYGIEAEMEHYGCMVDLLSRAGLIKEALDLVENMKIPPDPVLWGTLLAACKVHGFVDLGESIGKKLLEIEPTHDGHYVLLANIYAKARKWNDVANVRKLMADRGTCKAAGWSLIEAHGRVHRFIAGDRVHARSIDIYKMLRKIEKRLIEAGYTSDVTSVLHDIGDEEKEHAVREHSERLAIAFGLLVTDSRGTIRIVKNLRVCGDCHEVSKMISKVFEREIIVRDGSRFHHFKEGRCSCHDYW